MKLSDYVASFLVRENVAHVFGVTGGASLHLIHSVANTPGVEYVCPLHEQSAAMAADGHARISDNLGCAIGTSGPGATNMITGICCSYYDSIPVLYITGQVSIARFKGDTGVRQYGFQETDIVEMCRSVTKYAVTITEPTMIRYELEKAVYIAMHGRPGPVLIDIPDNIQRESIDVDQLVGFLPVIPLIDNLPDIADVVKLLKHAVRPVLIIGGGVRLASAEKIVIEMIERLNIPVLTTWATLDIVPHEHPLLVGTFGTHGTRYGNFAVQNSDCILAIGTRLDTHETGTPVSSFARDAVKIMVDIDQAELSKMSHFGLKIDCMLNLDAKLFIESMLDLCGQLYWDNNDWLIQISQWKEKYDACAPCYYAEAKLNPYVFIRSLSNVLTVDIPVVVDTGCSVAWMMQAYNVKQGQRVIHDYNNSAMGYALPASMGVSLAKKNGVTVCIIGDGSLHMNIQELATIQHYDLPVKIFVLNNNGYSMIKQTQDQWLESNYIGSSKNGGLPVVDLSAIAESYGYNVYEINTNKNIEKTIEEIIQSDGPVFCNVTVDENHRVIPQVAYGRPIEDPEPFLDRDEFINNMIIDVVD